MKSAERSCGDNYVPPWVAGFSVQWWHQEADPPLHNSSHRCHARPFLSELLDPGPTASSPWAHLPGNPDSALALSAANRWRDSSQALRELVAGVPTTREALTRLLEQKLDLGEPDIGFHFAAPPQRPEHFMAIVQACAFVFQQPLPADTLDQQCRVTGLPASHRLFALTPLQLLERLKGLDLVKALDEDWNQYWQARATGTWYRGANAPTNCIASISRRPS